MPKTAIVIGATGLVGAEVVKRLDQIDDIAKVVAITRRPVAYASRKIENQVIDFDHLAEFSGLFKGDTLFSCLGTTVQRAGSIEAQRIVDLDYQYIAASLAAEQGVSHYLLVSSSGANAKSLSPYLKMKGELEERVQALGFKHISIFQPSLLLGERTEVRVAEGLASKVLPVLCRLPGLSRFRPIYGTQVAQKMVAVSMQPAPACATYRLDEVFPD